MPTLIPDKLIGETTEIICTINDIDTKALVDTGSQVTSIPLAYFQKHFSDHQLQDVSKILRIETVGGQTLPYEGYFVCTISIPVTDSQSLTENVPVIVVPDTTYNSSVPLLLGTNILDHLRLFAVLPTSPALLLAVKSLTLVDRHLVKSQGVYTHVVSTADINVPPFSGQLTDGRAAIAIPVCQQIALVQDCTDSISVVPSLVSIKQGSNFVPVEIYNNSDSVLHIVKGEEIASLHQASIHVEQLTGESEFLDSFDVSHLSDQEATELKQFLEQNRDVFAMNMHEMGCTDVIEHRIELEDETPFKDKQRPIPPGMYEELRSHLAELLSAGVIKKSQSPFSSNIVLARKKDKSLHLCIDYRKLNSCSRRDGYSIPRIETLIDSLKGAKYFASLDLFAGYHQVSITEEHIASGPHSQLRAVSMSM